MTQLSVAADSARRQVCRGARGDATTGPSGSDYAEDRGSYAGAVRRDSGGRACDHADAPVPARDEPAENPEELRLHGRGLRERPDAGDDEILMLPRNTHVPPTSGEELWPTSKPVPPTPLVLTRYEPAEHLEESRPQGRGVRERLDAGDDETSVLPRNTLVPPTSGEEPRPTSKPVPQVTKAESRQRDGSEWRGESKTKVVSERGRLRLGEVMERRDYSFKREAGEIVTVFAFDFSPPNHMDGIWSQIDDHFCALLPTNAQLGQHCAPNATRIVGPSVM